MTTFNNVGFNLYLPNAQSTISTQVEIAGPKQDTFTALDRRLRNNLKFKEFAATLGYTADTVIYEIRSNEMGLCLLKNPIDSGTWFSAVPDNDQASEDLREIIKEFQKNFASQPRKKTEQKLPQFQQVIDQLKDWHKRDEKLRHTDSSNVPAANPPAIEWSKQKKVSPIAQDGKPDAQQPDIQPLAQKIASLQEHGHSAPASEPQQHNLQAEALKTNQSFSAERLEQKEKQSGLIIKPAHQPRIFQPTDKQLQNLQEKQDELKKQTKQYMKIANEMAQLYQTWRLLYQQCEKLKQDIEFFEGEKIQIPSPIIMDISEHEKQKEPIVKTAQTELDFQQMINETQDDLTKQVARYIGIASEKAKLYQECRQLSELVKTTQERLEDLLVEKNTKKHTLPFNAIEEKNLTLPLKIITEESVRII